MSLGERAILHITYDYGYGARGMPPKISGLSNLIFDIELLEIVQGGAGSSDDD